MTAGERWTPEEDEAIRKFFPQHGADWDGWERLVPGRTRSAIKGRANRLCVRTDDAPVRRNWTADEDAALMEFYPAHGGNWDGWPEVLPGRSKSSINGRASKLGFASTAAELRKRAKRARERVGTTGRRCGDCMHFVASDNPMVDAGTCMSARVMRTLGLRRHPGVLLGSDASECVFFEPKAPLFRPAGGGNE